MSFALGHTLHLATTHTSFDPRIVQKEARTLAAAGARVGVVVPADRDETGGAVAVHAVPRPRSGKERMTTTTAAVVRRAQAEARPDTIFHLHDADLLLPGLRLAWQGRTVIYDAHEDVPRQILHQPWLPRWLRHPVSMGYAALEAAAGRLLAGIVAAEPGIYARYPKAKTVLVRNFPILDELVAPGAPPYADREPIVAYVGGLTRPRGVFEMRDAVGALGDLRAELHLAGPFQPSSLQPEVLSGAPRVIAHGTLDRPAVARLLGRARVGLVVLQPTPKYLEAYPTKLFEYMSAGLPVVASDFDVIRPFVEGAQCGLLVDPSDPIAIEEAVRWVLEHPSEAEAMGKRGRAAVRDHYRWGPEGARLIRFYRELRASHPAPGRAASEPEL